MSKPFVYEMLCKSMGIASPLFLIHQQRPPRWIRQHTHRHRHNDMSNPCTYVPNFQDYGQTKNHPSTCFFRLKPWRYLLILILRIDASVGPWVPRRRAHPCVPYSRMDKFSQLPCRNMSDGRGWTEKPKTRSRSHHYSERERRPAIIVSPAIYISKTTPETQCNEETEKTTFLLAVARKHKERAHFVLGGTKRGDRSRSTTTHTEWTFVESFRSQRPPMGNIPNGRTGQCLTHARWGKNHSRQMDRGHRALWGEKHTTSNNAARSEGKIPF